MGCSGCNILEVYGSYVHVEGVTMRNATRALRFGGTASKGIVARRLTILKNTLEEAGVPEHVKAHWLAHTEALRPLVTADSGRECDPDRARLRVESVPNAPQPRRKGP